MRSKFLVSALVITGSCVTAAGAQPALSPVSPPETLFFLENAPPLRTLAGRIDIIRSEGGVPGPLVQGKPYSARAITESTQTLADGNRIVQRNEAVVYRDSAGRTRREQTLAGVGQWQSQQPVTLIQIHDPVAGKSYVLDPDARTARELRPLQMAIAHAQETISAGAVPAVPAPPPGREAPGVAVIERADGLEDVRVFTGAFGAGIAVAPFPGGTTGMYEAAEDLGEQVLEGLLVAGTRMTDTIPAGVIGNERAIEIVTERWHSKDIDATVLQRFTDPRAGETTYRLANVVLGEPSPELFEVPQGYAIEATNGPRVGVGAPPGRVIEIERRRVGSPR